MSRSMRPILTFLAACALVLAPATGMGEGLTVSQGNAGASLDFRIIIPPVMRVLENSHPRQLESFADGKVSAQQRLVVLSNMRGGFCASLRRAAPQLSTWKLETAPQSGIVLSPIADGYSLCGTRPGRYTVLLQHQFGTSDSSAKALNWPVQTDFSAI
jgi:hypothetical protein